MNDLNNWQPIYQEISELFGRQVAQQFFEQYRGTTITFPMHLLSRSGTIRAIKADHAAGLTIHDLSQMYSLTQRTIHRYLKL